MENKRELKDEELTNVSGGSKPITILPLVVFGLFTLKLANFIRGPKAADKVVK